MTLKNNMKELPVEPWVCDKMEQVLKSRFPEVGKVKIGFQLKTMNKPVKPKKPKVTDPVPTEYITIHKLLVFHNNENRFLLIDHNSHPLVFTDPDGGEINNELFPYWSQLEKLGFNWDLRSLKYSHYKQIESDCNIHGDFEATPQYNCDGYYDWTTISYTAIDPDYQTKLELYNNRFERYEKDLKVYEDELKKYENYKKDKKIKEFEEKINKLKVDQ